MNYIKIDKEDVCNGNGLRVVLWLSGCNHHCSGCHNPQTWDENEGFKFDDDAKNEIFKELDKPYTWESIFSNSDSNSSLRKNIIQGCDVLVDGPYIDSLRDITLAFRGSSNQRLIDVQETLKSGEVVLWSD